MTKGRSWDAAALVATRHRPNEVLIYQGLADFMFRILPQRLPLGRRDFVVRFIKYPFKVILLSHEGPVDMLMPG